LILNEVHFAHTTTSLCKSSVLKQKTLIKRACQGFYILIHNAVVGDGDLGRIQTCNLHSRNVVHYSVMLRGLINKRLVAFAAANIREFRILPTLFDNKLIIISLWKLYLKYASSNSQLRLAFSIFNP
tara:strand:+ start:27996 stop:28376 length:381 start_codon:yes stop_codon:yes gene_type:complete